VIKVELVDFIMNHTPNLDKINKIINEAIERNKFYENVVIILLVIIPIAGIVLCVWAFKTDSTTLKAFTVVLQSAVYWPINTLLKLRRLNVYLQIIPTLAIEGLSPAEARHEIRNFIKTLQERW